MIGLTGKMTAGKDTVFRRIQHSCPNMGFYRHGFADMLKESAAALLGVSTVFLDEVKSDPEVGLQIVSEHGGGLDSPMTFRTFLQRYGTEAHRDIFGESFWVNAAMGRMEEAVFDANERGLPYIPVFTDVRFENEAREIIVRGGKIVEVVGPDDDTGSHPSESGIPREMISYTIDNTIRDDDYKHLDTKIYYVLARLALDDVIFGGIKNA